MSEYNKKLFILAVVLTLFLVVLLWIKYSYFDFSPPVVFNAADSRHNGSGTQEKYIFTADTSLYHFSSHEGKMPVHSNFFSNHFLTYFPYRVGAWEGQDIEHQYADISLFRFYQNKKTKDLLWLIVVRGAHQSQFHSAEVCYLTDGWDVAVRDIKKVKMNGESFPLRYMIAQKENNIHLVGSWYMWPTPRRDLREGSLLFRISVELKENEEKGRLALLNFIEALANLSMEEKGLKVSKPSFPIAPTTPPPVLTKTSSFKEAKEKALSWILNQRVPNSVVPFPELDRRYFLLSYELNAAHPKTQNDKSYKYIYSRAAIYDNALGIIALTMTGHFSEAEGIIEAFDRVIGEDQRLWFGYNTHNEWPSGQNHDEAIIRSGASAWVGYAITYYIRKRWLDDPSFMEQKNVKRYLELTNKIARGLLKDRILYSKDPRYGLFTGGIGSHVLTLDIKTKKVIEKFKPDPVTWVSIEHNLDIYFFFKNLFLLTHNRAYEDYEEVKDTLENRLLTQAWNEREGQFRRGIRQNGKDEAMALDCASWGLLFLLSLKEGSPTKDKKISAILKALDRYQVLDPLASIRGYRPYYKGLIYDEIEINRLFYPHKPKKEWTDVQMIWSEGSLGVAMAYLKMGKQKEAERIIQEIIKMQVPGGGIQYATQEIPFQFSPSPSMAATAWLVMVISALENSQTLSLFWD